MFVKKITLYLTLSAVVFCSTGYAAGYYAASNKTGCGVVAIQAILGKQEADKGETKEEEKEAKAKAEADYQGYLKKKEALYKR